MKKVNCGKQIEKKDITCNDKRRELLESIECLTISDEIQLSANYYRPTLIEKIVKGWKKTDAVIQWTDDPICKAPVSVSTVMLHFRFYVKCLNV
jgi:hypothetical protein